MGDNTRCRARALFASMLVMFAPSPKVRVFTVGEPPNGENPFDFTKSPEEMQNSSTQAKFRCNKDFTGMSLEICILWNLVLAPRDCQRLRTSLAFGDYVTNFCKPTKGKRSGRLPQDPSKRRQSGLPPPCYMGRFTGGSTREQSQILEVIEGATVEKQSQIFGGYRRGNCREIRTAHRSNI